MCMNAGRLQGQTYQAKARTSRPPPIAVTVLHAPTATHATCDVRVGVERPGDDDSGNCRPDSPLRGHGQRHESSPSVSTEQCPTDGRTDR